MFNKLKAKFFSDRGDSTLVSTILVIPLIVGILITTIDVSVYFSNRSQILNSTRDAARQVAIFGGDGTATAGTPLEVAYGQSRNTSCAGLSTRDIVKEAYKTSSTATECNLLRSIANTASLISIRVIDVQCGVADGSSNFTGYKTSTMGQQVGCQLTWRYDSIPGSGLSFLSRAEVGAKGLKVTDHVTKVNTLAEVSMNGIYLQTWS